MGCGARAHGHRLDPSPAVAEKREHPVSLDPKTRGKSRLSEPPSRSGTAPGKCLNEDLAGRALAEKCRGAGAGAVGPRAEDRDEVADLGTGQQRLVGEPVERRAQAADDIRL